VNLFLFYILGEFLTVNNQMLLSAAINGVGTIGKSFSLPLPSEEDKNLSKKTVVDRLVSHFTNAKTNAKVCNIEAMIFRHEYVHYFSHYMNISY